MGGRCKFPCSKIKHADMYLAKLHLEYLISKNPLDDKMAVYLCEECRAKDGVEVWHVGHIRKNGTAYTKTADGRRSLKKVVINEHVSTYLDRS